MLHDRLQQDSWQQVQRSGLTKPLSAKVGTRAMTRSTTDTMPNGHVVSYASTSRELGFTNSQVLQAASQAQVATTRSRAAASSESASFRMASLRL